MMTNKAIRKNTLWTADRSNTSLLNAGEIHCLKKFINLKFGAIKIKKSVHQIQNSSNNIFYQICDLSKKISSPNHIFCQIHNSSNHHLPNKKIMFFPNSRFVELLSRYKLIPNLPGLTLQSLSPRPKPARLIIFAYLPGPRR